MKIEWHKLGTKKTVFAWLPEQAYRIGHNRYIHAVSKIWLKKVVLMWTLQGWIAYEDEQ